MPEKSAEEWLFEPQDWLDDKKTRADAVTSLIKKEIAAVNVENADKKRLQSRKDAAWYITFGVSLILSGLSLLKYAGVV